MMSLETFKFDLKLRFYQMCCKL